MCRMSDRKQYAKDFVLTVRTHKGGLLVATSTDLPGFVHTARSPEQMRSEIQAAVSDFWAADGKRLISFTSVEEAIAEPAFSKPETLRVHTELEAA